MEGAYEIIYVRYRRLLRQKHTGTDLTILEKKNPGYYCRLERLYKYLEIRVKPAKFSFGWYRIQSSNNSQDGNCSDQYQQSGDKQQLSVMNRSHLTYTGSRTVGMLETPTGGFSDNFIDYLSDLWLYYWRACIVAFSYFWLMLLSLWLHRSGRLRDPHHPVSKMTLREWFQYHNFHPYFVHDIFVPLFAAVCTNSWEAMLDYPAVDVLQYMAVGLGQESFVVSEGVQKVVEKLSSPVKNIHLDTQIQSIRLSKSPEYNMELVDVNGNVYGFHHVIFATQGNQAMRLLQSFLAELTNAEQQTPQQRRLIQDISQAIAMLQVFKYEKSLVINHTDEKLLPDDRRNWRALNLASVDESLKPGTDTASLRMPNPHNTTMATHILNFTHSAAATVDDDNTLYLQTTNPCIPPDASRVISVSWFERATVTLASRKAIQENLFIPVVGQQRGDSDDKENRDAVELGRCQGKSNIWFIGSYSWPGIPLLEGCVASAEKVVVDGIARSEGVEIKIPWDSC